MAERREEQKRLNVAALVYIFKPLLFCEHMFGIIRFQLVDNILQPPNLKTKIFGSLIILCYITANLSSLHITNKSASYDLVDEVPAFVILIQYAVSAITGPMYINSAMIGVFTTFAELDKLLRIERISDFYRESRKQTNNYLIFLMISHGTTCLVDFMTVAPSALDVGKILILPMYFLQKLEVVAFCQCIVMIKGRLAVINNYLSKFIKESNKGSMLFTIKQRKVIEEERLNFIGNASENNTKIRDLARAYDTLGDISSSINKIYNFQMFMTLISTFIQMIFTIWASLYFYKSTTNNDTGYLINNAIWCFSTISTVAVTTFACERLLIVRNETKVLVNKIIMDYDLPKTMRVQAKAFMELIEAWSLRIFIYDLYSVDISLMLKFISVATTYLIVIIQVSHFD